MRNECPTAKLVARPSVYKQSAEFRDAASQRWFAIFVVVLMALVVLAAVAVEILNASSAAGV
jgi:hypothetical protein